VVRALTSPVLRGMNGSSSLVLGTPGAGCTTFLRTIANERDGFANISGSVQYAGINSNEMAKTYKGEVVYNEEGKSFSYLLTPSQTTII
jgi:ATP-binding cassette, subfamily G (WHITE), member 2, SNQ2